MSEQLIALATIRIDGDTQPRVAIDQQAVTDYAAALERGNVFPPVCVMFDGVDHWLVDGFHRYHAHKKLGREQILAVVSTGVLAEAQWQSLTVNHTHGLRRTNEDKRKAISKALKMKPELSDGAIAEHVGVHLNTVLKYRQGMAKPATYTKCVSRIGRDGRKVRTAQIGRASGKRRGQSAIAPHTPIRGHSPVDDRRHIGMSKNPAMGARSLFEFFDRPYIQQLIGELQALLDGTAGLAPTLRDIPQVQES